MTTLLYADSILTVHIGYRSNTNRTLMPRSKGPGGGGTRWVTSCYSATPESWWGHLTRTPRCSVLRRRVCENTARTWRPRIASLLRRSDHGEKYKYYVLQEYRRLSHANQNATPSPSAHERRRGCQPLDSRPLAHPCLYTSKKPVSDNCCRDTRPSSYML